MTIRERAARWLREPLIHFLLAGALVFALLSGRPADPGDRRIVVDEALVVRLVDRWVQAYRRPPSPQEIDGLIADHVREQVLYREALRLGLDQGDEVVIKRMRNKMLSLASAEAEAKEPRDAELQALLDKHPARYAQTMRFDFTQVYLGDDNSANRARADSVLAQLTGGADPATLTRPAPLPLRFTGSSVEDISAQFGDSFVPAMQGVHNQWSGPIASGLGLHLVKVERRSSPSSPRIADVRQRLANDWRAASIKAAEEKAYRELLDGYEVTIARPK